MKTKPEKPVKKAPKKAPKKKVKKTKKKIVVRLDKTLQKEKVMIIETVVAIATNSTLTDAAEKLGITRQALHERIESHNLRPVLESIKTQAMDTLIMSSVKAAEKLVKEVGNSDPEIAIDVSKDILNRVGAKADNKAPAVALQVNTRVDYGSWGKPAEDKK